MIVRSDPMIEVIGERNSCDTTETKSDFSWANSDIFWLISCAAS